MRKRTILLVSLLMLLALSLMTTAYAASVTPGETVTIPISLSNSNGCFVKISVSYDSNIFEYVSISCPSGTASGKNMVMASLSTLPSGQCGSITLRVKDNAANGTYTIGASVVECWTINETAGSASASGGSVTVTGGACNHDAGEWKTVKESTCTEAGSKEKRCTKCQTVLETETITKLDHSAGEWKTVKEATCTEAGSKEKRCTKCQVVLETEAIEKLGHTAGEWKIVKEATCTAAGSKEKRCTKCQNVLETETIAKLEHTAGEWKTVKEATCLVDGVRAKNCTACQTELQTEAIPASEAYHAPGEWNVTAPTCTSEGLQTQSCIVCEKELKREVLPAEGHDDGKWIIIKDSTREEEGERQLQCTKCATVLDTQIIPVKTVIEYSMNACSLGFRFRDVNPELTEQWDMFTPIDLSQDGEQIYDLIAGNTHKIGSVKVLVENGTVTISYELCSKQIQVNKEFFTFFPSLQDVVTLDGEELTGFEFDNPISIEVDLKGDTDVLLYININVFYDSNTYGVEYFNPNGEEYAAFLETLQEQMN